MIKYYVAQNEMREMKCMRGGRMPERPHAAKDRRAVHRQRREHNSRPASA